MAVVVASAPLLSDSPQDLWDIAQVAQLTAVNVFAPIGP
jgi:hypothetical protein